MFLTMRLGLDGSHFICEFDKVLSPLLGLGPQGRVLGHGGHGYYHVDFHMLEGSRGR